jgi:hypothetical protein
VYPAVSPDEQLILQQPVAHDDAAKVVLGAADPDTTPPETEAPASEKIIIQEPEAQLSAEPGKRSLKSLLPWNETDTAEYPADGTSRQPASKQVSIEGLNSALSNALNTGLPSQEIVAKEHKELPPQYDWVAHAKKLGIPLSGVVEGLPPEEQQDTAHNMYLEQQRAVLGAGAKEVMIGTNALPQEPDLSGAWMAYDKAFRTQTPYKAPHDRSAENTKAYISAGNIGDKMAAAALDAKIKAARDVAQIKGAVIDTTAKSGTEKAAGSGKSGEDGLIKLARLFNASHGNKLREQYHRAQAGLDFSEIDLKSADNKQIGQYVLNNLGKMNLIAIKQQGKPSDYEQKAANLNPSMRAEVERVYNALVKGEARPEDTEIIGGIMKAMQSQALRDLDNTARNFAKGKAGTYTKERIHQYIKDWPDLPPEVKKEIEKESGEDPFIRALIKASEKMKKGKAK